MSAIDMRNLMSITEDGIRYQEELSDDGDISKVIAILKGKDSEKYTKLGRDLKRIEELEKEIKKLKAETKSEVKNLVSDLFEAEHAASTRVVDTVSFVFQLTKDPKPTVTYKYAEVLATLSNELTPELKVRLEEIKESFKSVTQKSAALSTYDKVHGKVPEGITEDAQVLSEGIIDMVKKFAATMKKKFFSWAKSYDAKLDALKAEAGM